MQRVLLVEDTDNLRDVLASVLRAEGYEVDAASCAEEALSMVGSTAFSCVLCDFKLPGQNGLELLRELRSRGVTTPFLLMTAYGSIGIAVDAMKLGANDFLTKPFEPAQLCRAMRDVIEVSRIVDRPSRARSAEGRSLLSASPVMHHVMKDARKVARVDTTVLLRGESGTGKELLARLIHDNSSRAQGPFLAVNCAAVPPELLESEFFGHEAGAFTGATQARPGLMELASGGTLFLDEVGDMPPSLQVKLLRALQEREIKRVGGTKTVSVNPRIVCATNQDLQAMLEAGSMREDFYYRIAVVVLRIPPLRERPEDIEMLSTHYLQQFGAGRGKYTVRLSDESRSLLKRYPWPGNIRELENIIERACIIAEEEIRPEHLGLKLPIDMQALQDTHKTLVEIAAQAAREAEIRLITDVLRQTAGNKSRAAKALGVSYKTLLHKVRDYALEPDDRGRAD